MESAVAVFRVDVEGKHEKVVLIQGRKANRIHWH